MYELQLVVLVAMMMISARGTVAAEVKGTKLSCLIQFLGLSQQRVLRFWCFKAILVVIFVG